MPNSKFVEKCKNCGNKISYSLKFNSGDPKYYPDKFQCMNEERHQIKSENDELVKALQQINSSDNSQYNAVIAPRDFVSHF
jgi:transcription elongation factor Elf1